VTTWFFNKRKRVAHGMCSKPPLIHQVNTAHSDDQDATEADAVALVQIDENLTLPPSLLSHSTGHNCDLTLPSLTSDVGGGGLGGGSKRYHKCENCITCNVCVFNIDGGICEDIQDNSVLYCNSCWQRTCSACENEQLAFCHHDTPPDVSTWNNMLAAMPEY
jgi:hypothetical protein